MKKKLEVHLHTNTSCNLHCKHCYNNSGESVSAMLSEKTVLHLIQILCEEYDAEFHLEGGEIFLRPDLLAAMDELPVEYLKHITITTNGTILMQEPKIISTLKKISALRVSVEGHTDKHQQTVRGTTLNQVLHIAKQYQALGVPVWLRITLNRLNVEGFVEHTIPALQSQGFGHIQVYEFQQVGRGKQNSDELALNGDFEDFLADLITYSDKLVGTVRLMFPRRRIEEVRKHRKSLEGRGYYVQEIGQECGISIHPNGQVYLCAWENDPSVSFGNILQMQDTQLITLLEQTDLTHTCEFCSAIRILKEERQSE